MVQHLGCSGYACGRRPSLRSHQSRRARLRLEPGRGRLLPPEAHPGRRRLPRWRRAEPVPGLLGAELPERRGREPARPCGHAGAAHAPPPAASREDSEVKSPGWCFISRGPVGPPPLGGLRDLGVIPASRPRRAPGGWSGPECSQPWPCPGTLARAPSSSRQACSGSALLSREACVGASRCLTTPFSGHRGAPARGTGSRCDGRAQGLLPQLGGPFDSEKPP